jgi:hypothetical protein
MAMKRLAPRDACGREARPVNRNGDAKYCRRQLLFTPTVIPLAAPQVVYFTNLLNNLDRITLSLMRARYHPIGIGRLSLL